MTLQSKIDKLPLSIEFGARLYHLYISMYKSSVRIMYRCTQPIYKNIIINTNNKDVHLPLAQRLEDVVDRVLTIIENKEWDMQ